MAKTPSKTSSKSIKTTSVNTSSARSAPLAKLATILPWLLVIGAVVGIIASVMITIEKFDLASNPHYQPICDLNPIVSCGSVMASKQAHAFGFMNTYIGLLGFPVLLTIGMAMFAGANFKRWFWQGTQIGLTFGFVFAYWLLFESVYRIRALCPYCLSVDVAITVLFWYITLYNFYSGNFALPAGFKTTGQFVKRHHVDLLVLWFILVITLILQHFWYYFGQHL
jgi:uncharacterized membrane protein